MPLLKQCFIFQTNCFAMHFQQTHTFPFMWKVCEAASPPFHHQETPRKLRSQHSPTWSFGCGVIGQSSLSVPCGIKLETTCCEFTEELHKHAPITLSSTTPPLFSFYFGRPEFFNIKRVRVRAHVGKKPQSASCYKALILETPSLSIT